MNKPLELKVYPAGGCFTSADCELKQWCVECVEEVDKRFTDAELAAEYHFARLDSRVRSARQQYSPSDVNWHHYLKGLDQEAAFERFATLPHYDEPTP